MPRKGTKKLSLKDVLQRETQPDYVNFVLSEYSDSDSGYENLLDPNEAIVTNYVAVKPEKQKKESVSTSRKIQKIPPIWLRNCPLQKIEENIKMIIDYENDKQKEFPKIFPLQKLPPLQFINQKQRDLFLFRVETANQYIIDEQRKTELKKTFGEIKQIINNQKRTTEEISKWRVTMQTILVQTCRRLEDFLKEHLGLKPIPLTRIEYREIQNMLLNLAQTFEPDFCESFLNLVKLTYRLPNITLQRVLQVTRLYKTIQMAAKVKIKMRLQAIQRNKKLDIKLQTFTQLTVKTKLKSIWNYEFEKIMINSYKKNQNFGYIKEELQKQYPQHTGCFTANEIKDRFHSLIRAALRIVRNRLKQHSANGEVPKLFGLNEKRFKIISKSRLAIHLRLWLLQLYKKDNCKIQEILDMVDMMNEFVYTKQNSRDTSSMGTTSLAGSRVSNFTFSQQESTFKLESGTDCDKSQNPTRINSHYEQNESNLQQNGSTMQQKQSFIHNMYFWGDQSNVEPSQDF